MSLPKKTLAYLVLSTAAFIGAALYLIRGQALSSLARVEREQTATDVANACALVRHCAKDYGDPLSSWSDSDPMEQFLRDGNQAFLDSKISAAALTQELQADVLVIARDEGVPVYATQVNAAGTALEPCSDAFLEHLTPRGLMRPGEPFTGLLAVEGHTYVVSSRPIRNAKGNEGPVRGRLVAAAEIDRAWLQGLRELCSLDLELTRSSEKPSSAEELAARASLGTGAASVVAESSDQRISGYGLLPDLYGKPELVLHVSRERAVRQAGHGILMGMLWTLVGGGVLLGLLTYFAAWRTMLNPVQRLLACTRRLWRGERSHVVFHSGDELEALARDINRMTDAVFATEEALQNVQRGSADGTAPALPSAPSRVIRR